MPRKLRTHNRYMWSVFDQGANHYLAERYVKGEDGKDHYEQHELHAHCLACAKSDVLAKYGGVVDLRGWHNQGLCGSFLLSMQDTVNQEKPEETDGTEK